MFRVDSLHLAYAQHDNAAMQIFRKTLFNFSSLLEAITNSWLMIVKILWLQVYNKITEYMKATGYHEKTIYLYDKYLRSQFETYT